MPTTLKYGITYPSGSAAPNVPLAMQTQAESVEAALDNLETDWTTLTLTGGWLAYAGGGGYFNGLRYRKVGDNVQISGMIKSGAANTVMATLPADARPAKAVIMFVNSSGGAGQIQVDPTTGNITYMTGSPTTPAYLSVNLFIPLS